jgi:hypothetical protein
MGEIRNSRGWLTKLALAAGYMEQQSWLDGDGWHYVTLRLDALGDRYLVRHVVDSADTGSTAWFFESNQLRLARTKFQQEVRR